jgi:polysaccharide pyruvyl transferase WcaK-like protein
MNTKKIIISGVIGGGNKGDLAILESEIQELRRILTNSEISVSASFPETLKSVIPGVKIILPLIDRPTISAYLKVKNRNSFRFKIYLGLYITKMFYQCGLVALSAITSRLGFPSFYRPLVVEEFSNSDIVIITGGEGGKEGSSFLSEYAFNKQKIGWWIFLFRELCNMLIISKCFRKPIIIFPNTVGPIRTTIGHNLSKAIFKCADITMVRDAFSELTLKSLQVNNFVRTNDVALLLQNDKMERKNTLPSHTIGVSPGLFDLTSNPTLKQKYLLAHAKALDQLIETEAFNIVFLPSNLRHDMQQTNDLIISQMIIDNMKQKNKVQIIKATDAKELQTILKQIDLLIATRMHPMILACTQNVPFVSIIYDYKQLGFLSDLELENFAIIVNDITAEKMLTKIKFVLQNKDLIQLILNSRVAQLRNRTRQIIDVVIHVATDSK